MKWFSLLLIIPFSKTRTLFVFNLFCLEYIIWISSSVLIAKRTTTNDKKKKKRRFNSILVFVWLFVSLNKQNQKQSSLFCWQYTKNKTPNQTTKGYPLLFFLFVCYWSVKNHLNKIFNQHTHTADMIRQVKVNTFRENTDPNNQSEKSFS